MNQVILLEDGWKRLKEGGVQKIEQILESVQGGDYKSGITTEEYSSLYTTVYTMCTQKPPNNWSEVRTPSLVGCASRAWPNPALPRSSAESPSLCARALTCRCAPRACLLCLQQHLYNNYCDAVKDYLSARILPRIKEKHDEGACPKRGTTRKSSRLTERHRHAAATNKEACARHRVRMTL